jgi:hypothetical protein
MCWIIYFYSLVMEEAAQILEVETFIPMLLQTADTTLSVSVSANNGSGSTSPSSVTAVSRVEMGNNSSDAGTSRLKRVVLIGKCPG